MRGWEYRKLKLLCSYQLFILIFSCFPWINALWIASYLWLISSFKRVDSDNFCQCSHCFHGGKISSEVLILSFLLRSSPDSFYINVSLLCLTHFIFWLFCFCSAPFHSNFLILHFQSKHFFSYLMSFKYSFTSSVIGLTKGFYPPSPRLLQQCLNWSLCSSLIHFSSIHHATARLIILKHKPDCAFPC